MAELLKESSGLLPVNKPRFITSYDVIRILKKQAVFSKIGHGGTLDPMAEGVLLILIGRATRLFDKIRKMKKTYTAEISFGFETDTDDITGKVTCISDLRPSKSRAEEILKTFTGEIRQEPPAYSAVKHKGKNLYEYARKGIMIKPVVKNVTIYSIKMLSFSRDSMTLKIECSGGTYIRSIARDFGRKTGSLAALKALRREKIGNFDLSKCASLENLKNGGISGFIIGINEENNNSWLF